MVPLVTRLDFSGITQIATHCDWDVMTQYVLERQNLDILKLLGNCFYVDVVKNCTTNEYQDLLNGSTFETECGGETKEMVHFGLKRVLVHFAYGAYIYRHGIVDTPFGVVMKQSRDSVPVSQADLKIVHDENRKMGYSYWKQTLEYLCANKELFPKMDTSICKSCDSCGCSKCDGKGCDKCKGGTTDGTRRSRITLISNNG